MSECFRGNMFPDGHGEDQPDCPRRDFHHFHEEDMFRHFDEMFREFDEMFKSMGIAEFPRGHHGEYWYFRIPT